MATTKEEFKVLVLFFSKRGRLLSLARQIEAGAKEQGVKVTVRRIDSPLRADDPERFEREIKQIALVTETELLAADAIILGAPGRQGRVCGQMSAYLDTWCKFIERGQLKGKIGSAFTSSGGIDRGFGGHEAVFQGFISTFLQQGMFYVGAPPTPRMDLCLAGTPFGSCMAGGRGTGGRELTDDEIFVARSQGAHVAKIVKNMRGTVAKEHTDFSKVLQMVREKCEQRSGSNKSARLVARQGFRFFDKNGSGSIDINEFCDAVNSFSSSLDSNLLRALFKHLDTDGSGLIEYEEFLKMVFA